MSHVNIDTAPSCLADVADLARRVGTGLDPFTIHCHASAADIHDVIGRCFGVSAGLQRLAREIRSLRDEDVFEDFADDIIHVLYSADCTFKEIFRITGDELLNASQAGLSQSDGSQRCWKLLCSHFERESGNPLQKRLTYYEVFLGDLASAIGEGAPEDEESFDSIADRIRNLYLVQKPKFAGGNGGRRGSRRPEPAPSPPQSPASPSLSKPPSFERRRPSRSQTSPDIPRRRRSQSRHRSPHYSHRRPSPIRRATSPPPRHHRPSFTGNRYYDYRYDARLSSPSGSSQSSSMEPGWRPPPPAPEPPLSPTPSSHIFSSSSSTSGTRSTHSGHGHGHSHNKHWVKRIFEQKPPMTPLAPTGKSGCWASHHPRTLEQLEERGFEKIQELLFEEKTMRVSLWQEPTQHRGKMLCEGRASNKSPITAAKSLTDLVVERSGSFLKFRLNHGGDAWAGLRFVTTEQLVIFHSIFLALRSHDSYDPLEKIRDHRIKGEEEAFEGVIYDDRYHHFLKLLVDKDSRCVRLQASVLEGAIARTPVWTSFITHTIHSPTFYTRVNAKTIHLPELHRYIFTDNGDYAAQTAPGGMHELVFLRSSLADAFEVAIEEARQISTAGKSKDKDKGKGKGKGKAGEESGGKKKK